MTLQAENPPNQHHFVRDRNDVTVFDAGSPLFI
jgi:hypothetical protein